MATENLITEQFLTIQGEGRSVGRLAYFIRLAGCNLRCSWCDSLHSVEPSLFKGKTFPVDYSKIPPHCRLFVITGGEPTLFDLSALRENLLRISPDCEIEIETNATKFPKFILNEFRWNLSPKLKSSGQKNAELDAKRLTHLRDWSDYAQQGLGNVTFKFVITGPSDLDEVVELVNELRIPAHLVYLMGQGQTPESQSIDALAYILDFAKLNGFNLSPRLHVIYWGSQRGV